MKKAFVILISILSCTVGVAQQLTASLDTATIRIGEVATYTLSLTLPAGVTAAEVTWPASADTLARSIEVLNSAADLEADSVGVLRMTYQLTSWDTGAWAIPPQKATVQGREIEGPASLLRVVPTMVNSKDPPRALKDILPMPFSLRAWLLAHQAELFTALGLLLAIILAVVLWKRRKKPIIPTVVTAPQTPAHQRCLEALHEVEQQRLWQQGEHKLYQSRVTDLLRGYIEERYAVPALERTTDELMAELRLSPLPTDERIRLENLLRAADLVKFAKMVPSAVENEQLMQAARQFVQATAVRTEAPAHEA
jgi:LPXTG-motif cell wall-anchored protein